MHPVLSGMFRIKPHIATARPTGSRQAACSGRYVPSAETSGLYGAQVIIGLLRPFSGIRRRRVSLQLVPLDFSLDDK